MSLTRISKERRYGVISVDERRALDGLEFVQGLGHAEAAHRSVESLKFAGDAFFTDVEAFCQALKRKGG